MQVENKGLNNVHPGIKKQALNNRLAHSNSGRMSNSNKFKKFSTHNIIYEDPKENMFQNSQTN